MCKVLSQFPEQNAIKQETYCDMMEISFAGS